MIRIALAVKGQEAEVSITDNGNGIPEEIRDKLFQPNFTTKTSGMGMGLAISSSIVRSLGGKIWYDTEPDKGTIFYVSLPLYLIDQIWTQGLVENCQYLIFSPGTNKGFYYYLGFRSQKLMTPLLFLRRKIYLTLILIGLISLQGVRPDCTISGIINSYASD